MHTFIKNCIFDGVQKKGGNKIISVENIVFEEVRINSRKFVQSIEQNL